MRFHEAVLLLLMVAPAVPAQSIALPPQARQTAAILGISGAIDSFEALRIEPASTETTVRGLVLRQRITEALFEANLDVDAVVASIQREEDQTQEARDSLSAQRDRVAGLVTTGATIAGSGIGIIGSAMQFSHETAYAGDGVSIASGAASTVLSLLAMRLRHSGKTQVEIAPNMLARLFGRPSDEANVWPEDVWAYLNSAPAPGVRGGTRVELLKQAWVREGRIGLQGSAAAERRVAFLTSSISGARRVTLNELSDRSAMLSDLRSQVALMKRDIAELVHYLRQAGW